MENKKENFIKKSKKKFGDFLDYSKVEYTSCKHKVLLTCPIHGDFYVTPDSHLQSKFPCPKCAYNNTANNQRKSKDSFIEQAKAIHGNKYNYDSVDYKKNNIKVKIFCKKHGFFYQTPSNHLLGKGCPKCRDEFLREKFSLPKEYVNKKVEEKFKGNIKILTDFYHNVDSKILANCSHHGDFETTVYYLLNCKYACPLCAEKEKSFSSSETKLIKKIETLSEKFNGKYDYKIESYKTDTKKIKIVCPIHGEFEQSITSHLASPTGCPKCSIKNSYIENKIQKYLEKNNIIFEKNNRSILNGLEIDFYIPEFKVGIECNGIFWHSELAGKDKKYHLSKTEMSNKSGIFLIHIFENEINEKWRIVESRLNSIFKRNKRRIYGRQCTVKFISKKEKTKFLNKYHLQGDCGSCLEVGLFYKNRLVSVMSFGKLRLALGQKNQEKSFELIRYSSNFNFYIIGGASKMLKFFEKEINPKTVVSYSDRRWSVGEIYKILGFELVKCTKPNYHYFKRGSANLYHRFSFRKSVLDKKLKIFDKTKSEWYNMRQNGWNRIWDCGHLKFKKDYAEK